MHIRRITVSESAKITKRLSLPCRCRSLPLCDLSLSPFPLFFCRTFHFGCLLIFSLIFCSGNLFVYLFWGCYFCIRPRPISRRVAFIGCQCPHSLSLLRLIVYFCDRFLTFLLCVFLLFLLLLLLLLFFFFSHLIYRLSLCFDSCISQWTQKTLEKVCGSSDIHFFY